ncbi:hypothetical protein DLREEDagrD3_09120 [Denitratisoma sp. agr-D3]
MADATGDDKHFMNQSVQNPIDDLVSRLDQVVASFLEGGAPEARDRSIASLSREVLLLEEVSVGLGEMAASLLSFFKTASELALSEGDRDQVRSMWLSLRHRLLGQDDAASDMPELVAPVAHSGPPPSNRVVSLMVESPAIQMLLQTALVDAGYELAPLDSIQSLSSLAPDILPLAIVADLSRCREELDIARVIAQVRQQSGNTVHLFCLSEADDFEARLEAVRLGATRFMKKPVDVKKLLDILNGVTARIPMEPFRVLFVDDDRAHTLIYSTVLAEAGCRVEVCNDALLAPSVVARFAPDVIVTDVYMPGCNGLELAALLRQDEALVDTPILFLSSESNLERQMAALDLGGDDFLTKPVTLEVLVPAILARAKRARMLKRVRHELDEARRGAEQASRAKSRFMADMNHELKVPLNAMLGYAQLIALEVRSPSADPQVHQDSLLKAVDQICDAGEDQLRLVNEILELSKAEAGRLTVIAENVELSPLLDQCFGLLRPQVEKRRLRCENQVPPGICLRADPQRLKQVLLNLLSNGIKYNREQGSLRVYCREADEHGVQVVVADTGRGMPKEFLQDLFKPFSRLHMERKGEVEGTGLGLALVKSLVEAMDGVVGVASQEGVGSEFCFTLPAARPDS